MSERPLVSVVITTKNEERVIEDCLRSIKEQTYPNIEIIVVDNASTDRTKELARKYTEKVYDKGPERSAQRNYGMIEVARGDYVMYVDADMLLSPSLIEGCVKTMGKEEGIVALYIPEIILGKNFFSKVRRFERVFYNGTVIDAARFFFRKKFIEGGGFDVTLCGVEDWDMDKRIKTFGKVLLLSYPENSYTGFVSSFVKERGITRLPKFSCVFHNESEFNLRKYLSKKNYYTKSFHPYIEKWGKDDPDLRKQLGFFYRYIGVFVEKGKWKRIMLHPVLTMGMFFLRVLVGGVFFLEILQSKKRA
ncbi:glycosyltransferase family 2 protein [Thermospira aquatica]|uniref:Glycosyltransferase n=1 Tax=Thermospira aquatica TaxID=2828656 RepID=A0AAX3BBM8_9SPIR|nr:glycosyltransferase [Thermospira aquatica]URA09697.1 glycosyltransferase [Thermospira aquatica]